jgi:ABC-type glycerol-3-phosphate transport system permease component
MATAYTGNSHLPWWALIVALLLATIMFPFAVVVSATTGFSVDVQQLAQMLGAALVPGNPQANLYFTMFGSNTVGQAKDLTVDLKLGRKLCSTYSTLSAHSIL